MIFLIDRFVKYDNNFAVINKISEYYQIQQIE